ncbi:hypothetical protein NOVOSPHI9U_50051 [Novosphingobium sp. 9U]|nr:hypothetical protein NOVOSPHI9U_50051 [Novosphingobium sp. 9U]
MAGTAVVSGAATAAGGTWIVGAASWARTGVEPSARTADIAAVALSDRVNVCVMTMRMRNLRQSYSADTHFPDQSSTRKR